MIGRTVTLFGRPYAWDLWGQGVIDGETQVQWRLTNRCDICGRTMDRHERHGYMVSTGGADDFDVVCIDAEGYELGPVTKPCTCHGLIACPDPPDPPF